MLFVSISLDFMPIGASSTSGIGLYIYECIYTSFHRNANDVQLLRLGWLEACSHFVCATTLFHRRDYSPFENVCTNKTIHTMLYKIN